MAGAIDLYSGTNSITGSNLFTVDKNPLNQLDSGVEDVIGKQANAVANAMWQAIQMVIDMMLGIDPNTAKAGTGQVNSVIQFLDNLLAMLGLSNTSGGTNDPTSSAWNLNSLITWIEQLLLPTNSLAPIVGNANNSGGVTGFVPIENLAIDILGQLIGGAQGVIDAILATVGFPAGSGTETDVNKYFADFLAMFANPALTNSAFNAATATENYILNLIHPTNLLAPMDPTTQLIAPLNIPNITLAMSTDMQSIIDSFANTFLGLPGSGYQIPDLIRSIESIPGQLITGTVSAAQASHINIGALSAYIPQYLVNGNFDTANSIIGQSIWTWDGTQGPPGVSTSVYTTANGTIRELYSNPIYCYGPIGANPGQSFTISAMTRWAGLSGGTVALTVAKYNGATLVGYDTIQAATSPSGTQTTWQSLSGTYTVPANVTTIFVRPMVGADAASGQVWFGQMSAQPGGSNSTALHPDLLQNIPISKSTDMQAIVNGIINSFSEGASAFNQSVANSAMANLWGMVVQNAGQVQGLIQSTSGANNSGMSAVVNFSALPNSSTLTNFATTYTGTGSSRCTIVNGAAHWSTVGDGNVFGRFIYNPPSGPAVTNTDYQRVGGTAGTGTGFANGQSAAGYLLARADTLTSPQNYVYGKITTNGLLGYTIELGCVVGGVVHNPASSTPWGATAGYPWNSSIYLLTGVGGNPRRFQILAGSQVVVDWTETSGTSQVGSGFRHFGFGGDLMGGGYAAPSDIVSGSVSDNQPPTVKGSSFRVYRGTTTSISTAGAVTSPAASHFDTVDYASADYPPASWDGTNLTIGIEGTHFFHVRYNITTMQAATAAAPCLYRTRSGTQTLIRQMGGIFSDAVGDHPNGMDGTTQLYCAAGDVITPGYTVGGSTTFTGESSGTTSYFEAALMNLSYT